MPGFLRNFTLDSVSFGLGVLFGILLLWIFGKILPGVRTAWQGWRIHRQDTHTHAASEAEAHHRFDTLRLAQRMHLASSLFALDEIILEPRVQAPPIQIVPGQEFIEQDITSSTIPYLPDWPELPAAFQTKTLTLEQALSGGANLILMGNPGSGKTVALARLATRVARREPSVGELGELLPVFIHISDLLPGGNFTGDPLDRLIKAVTYQVSRGNLARLSELLKLAFLSGNVLLLLDGLDEAPPELHDEGSAFLTKLIEQFPGIRVIVSASPNNISGLTALGFLPVALASWDEPACQQFIHLWGERWQQFILPSQEPGMKPVDQHLMDAWLGGSSSLLSPLELTLKVWSAYAGDALGPGALEAIQAYLNRTTAGLNSARFDLEILAWHLTSTLRIAFPAKVEQPQVGENSPVDPSSLSESDSIEPSDFSKVDQELRKVLGNHIPWLVEAGVLVWRRDNRLAFIHPVISGALAAAGFLSQPDDQLLLKQPEWTGKENVLSFLAATTECSPLFQAQIEPEVDPRFHQTLQLARWLRVAPVGQPWRTAVLRSLAATLQNDSQPLSLRGRILCALVKSGDPGISKLFIQMLNSSSESQRMLAILGMGLGQDRQAVPQLSNLLDDPSPAIGRAGCLALAAIGDKAALESLAWALMHGGNTTRRAAAEALARFPVEGYSILEEGSQVDNLLVRRAVIYGLIQVHQPGALEILKDLAIEDKEWVVRAAATNALESIKLPEASIPHPLPALSESAWLIAFAGELGLGVSPGKQAEDMLRKALVEGSEEQKLAALDYLRLFGNKDDIHLILTVQKDFPGELRESAFNALWHLGAAGLSPA